MMSQYEYRCVGIPPAFQEEVNKKDYLTAVEAYERLITREAQGGWELDKIDSVIAYQNPGCMKWGQKPIEVVHKVLIFRRLIQ
jgi:hypothetical protein